MNRYRVRVKYPWGERYLNYSKITILEKNETTGEVYYSAEISERTYEAKGYASVEDMAKAYMKYQCENHRLSVSTLPSFVMHTPYCYSWDIVMNRPNKKGELEPRTEHITRYILRELDYENPISNID